MTATQHDRDLVRVIENTRCVLLDFDGPICQVFAGVLASTVAAELRAVITAQGVAIPSHVRNKAGPHDLLHFAATISASLAQQVDRTLRTAETEAADSAQPTSGATELLTACRDTSRPVAIVSNNAREAVTAYLARAGITDFINHIEGRDPRDPALMKPNPYLVSQALHALDASPSECTLVGDSQTDIHAAHRAGVQSISYINKPEKAARLAAAGADAQVDDMADLARALRSQTVIPQPFRQ